MSRLLRQFRRSVKKKRTLLRRFLTRLEKNPPGGLDRQVEQLEKEMWKDVDCLQCANCCKTMTPTYTVRDIKRIAGHLEMSPGEFRKKWLRKERGTGDWLNKSTPCQFLEKGTNHCKIYEVRPADCSGFPHLLKKRTVDYVHVHHQNVDQCPATFRLVERMEQEIGGRV